MAEQGVSGYTSTLSNNGYKIRLHYDQKYDIEKNQSTITMYMEGYHDSYAPTYADGKVYVNNTLVQTWQTSYGTDGGLAPNGNWQRVGNSTFTATISHNQDGTGAITVKLGKNKYDSFQFVNYNYSHTHASFSGSWNITLTTIPRTSSIGSADNIKLGEACKITWTPNARTFKYKIKFVLGSWNFTTDYISPNTISSYTYDGYTFPLDIAEQLPNSINGTMTAYLYTYNNTTQVGSPDTKTFTVTIPDSVVPTLGNVTASMVNSNSVVNGWNLAVVGFTKVKIDATATGVYGSTISSFTISGGYSTTQNGSALSYTGAVITSSGNKTFTVIATDSRGRKSVSKTTSAITFYAYSAPQTTLFSITRSTTNSTKMVAKANWTFSSVNGKNSVTATLYYKLSTQSDWIMYDGTIPKNTSTTLTLDFAETSSYNFKLEVVDLLSSKAEEDGFSSTISVTMDFRAGGKGVGIGKIAESDNLEIAFDTIFMGNVYIQSPDGTKVSLADYIKSFIT